MYNSTFAKSSGAQILGRGAGLRHSGRINQYLVKEIMEATPQQLLIRVYDFAIVNCQKKDFMRTNAAVQELINSLRFEGEDVKAVSMGLLRLYLFCQDQARKNNFDIVQKILSELREAWLKIF